MSRRDKVMGDLKKSIKEALKWIWQFPQNMLAVCLESILCNADKGY